jgi:DNA-binding MarR family transcriptional regulator
MALQGDSNFESMLPEDKSSEDGVVTLLSMPGYLIRRSKQLTTFAFSSISKSHGITPVQYAALSILNARPALDQTELAEIAGLDATTTGGVLQRLEARGLISRSDVGNRRVSSLTCDGLELLAQLHPAVAKAQIKVLSPLTKREQMQLLRLMSKLNGVSNRYYKVPHKAGAA